MSSRLGARLIVDKCKATVRYVGAIDDQQGTWVGLEWDDISRGRHDGIVGGRRYFACKHSGPRGSFVREAKLQQVADLGIDLPLAITRRYAHVSRWLNFYIILRIVRDAGHTDVTAH